MQGLPTLIAFAATARHGSFAAAARDQGQAPSTLAKAVARLEAQLGLKLFHRTTRQVRLTADGEQLYQRCQRVLTELEELQTIASGTRAAPSGELRLAMPVFYGKRFVLPRLAELLRKHPGLTLDARLSDQYVDIVREGMDLAVRIGELDDSSLVARRVDWQSLTLCASPAYLKRAGTPRRVEDLSAHAAILFRLPSTGRDRPWLLRQRGQSVTLQPQPALRINETEAVLEALLLGLGLAQLPDNVVADDIAAGRLVELLPGCCPPRIPVHLVMPPGRLVPPRVRAAIAVLENLSQH
jgi:LysR family transcriptional regulator, regulator for bpeEF and oprC